MKEKTMYSFKKNRYSFKAKVCYSVYSTSVRHKVYLNCIKYYFKLSTQLILLQIINTFSIIKWASQIITKIINTDYFLHLVYASLSAAISSLDLVQSISIKLSSSVPSPFIAWKQYQYNLLKTEIKYWK